MVERVTGKKPVELENRIELPDSMKEIWYWFLALNNTRTSGFGMSPITYTEMGNYFNLHQIEVEPFEIEVIKLLDSVAMEHSQKQQEKSKNNNKKK